MALLKKRKINEDELTYSDNVGIQWEALFQSGNFNDKTKHFKIHCILFQCQEKKFQKEKRIWSDMMVFNSESL